MHITSNNLQGSPKSLDRFPIITKLLLIIFYLISVTKSQGPSLSLSLSSPTINTNSVYNFEFVDSNLASRDGTITIVFDSSLFSIGTVSVYNTDNITKIYTHNVVNSYTIAITYTRPTELSPVIKLSIASITNPGSKTSCTFVYKFTSSGTEYVSYSKTLSPFTTAALAACSISFSPSFTNTQSEVTVSLTLRNPVGVGGTISVGFPSLWQNSYSDQLYNPIMRSSTTCTKLSGSSLSDTLTCNIISQQIYVDSAFASSASSGQTVSFKMTGILTPATISSNNFVTISTETPTNGYLIDQSQCSITPVSPQVLTISSSSTFTVGQSSQILSVSWITSSPIQVGDSITVTLPANYMQFGSGSPFISYNNGKSISSSVQTISTQVRKFTITSISEASLVSPTQTIDISFIYVKCLVDTSPRLVTITVSRNNYNIASGTLSITPSPNTMTSGSISSTITTVSASTSLTINFTTTNQIPTSSGSLKIQLPTSFQKTGSQPTCSITSSTTFTALSGTPVCSLSGYDLTITGFLSGTLIQASQLSITISNVLINPMTIKPTDSFIISTLSAALYAIDQLSTLQYTATIGSITSLSIVPTTATVGLDTIYTLVYTLTRKIPTGSTLALTLPLTVTIPSSTPLYQYRVNTETYSNVIPTVSTPSSNVVLTFTNIVVGELSAGESISITITNLHNPESLEPTQSFQLHTLSSENYAIQQILTGKSITLTTMSSFSELSPLLLNSLRVNGATRDYTFYIKTLITLPSSGKLILQLINNPANNALQFSSQINICEITTLSLTNACAVSNNQLTITLSGSVPASSTTQYKLIVSSIILARTMQSTSQFKLTALNANGYGIMTSTVAGLVNLQPNQLPVFTMNILTTPSQLNQKQQFSLSFTMFNPIYFIDDQYIQVEIPSSYLFIGSTSSPNLCTNSNINCTISDPSSPNLIQIKSNTISTSTSSLSITIKSDTYVSPQDFTYLSNYFYLTTYQSSTNTQIDITSTTITPVTFYTTCNHHCKTCQSSNLTFCTTCYSSSSGYNLSATYQQYIYMTSDNLCVNQCGNGYYNNSGTCTRCLSPCASCSLIGSNCTACVDGYYYDDVGLACVITCPALTYSDATTNTCEPCSINCQNCGTNSVTCTSCAGALYLSGNTCVTVCTTGYYKQTNPNQCKICNSGCNGCTDNAADCVACATGYFQQDPNLNTCVSSCGTGTVSNPETGLCQCLGSCDTCQGSLTSCTGCANGMLLYASTCISECPAQTYQEDTECLECQDSNCITCTNTQCSQCSTGYLLYGGLCYSECPTGTFKSNNLYACQLCGTGCKTCLNAEICQICFNGFLVEGVSCVTTCSSEYINFNATSCVTQCPSGYTNTSSRCTLDPTNTTNNTNTTNETNTTNVTNTTEQIPTFVPFPFTIGYILSTSTAIGMKCLFPSTLLPVTIMGFGAVWEMASTVTLIVVGYIEEDAAAAARLLQTTSTTTTNSIAIPLFILIVGLGILLILNITNLILIPKYLHTDHKFKSHYNRYKSSHIVLRIISCITCFKLYELVFSNILGVRFFKAKLQFVNRLFVFNILFGISIFWSVFILVGAGLINYYKQDQKLYSGAFIQSIDCLLIVSLNIIPTILVLRRNSDDYEKEITDGDQKRYETHDQLAFNDNSGVGIEEVFVEERGAGYANQSRVSQSRRDYFYKASNSNGGIQRDGDQEEGPLARKDPNTKNPINHQADNSAIPLSGFKQKESKVTQLGQLNQNQQISQIQLEEPVRDNLINQSPSNANNKNGEGNTQMRNYQGYDLDPKLLKLSENSAQFKKLPAQTKAKIRLAKANLRINKNSVDLNTKETINHDLEEIQLSPKNKKQNKIDENGQQIEGTDQQSGKTKKNKSKSKGKGKGQGKQKLKSGKKSQQKQKNGSLSKKKNVRGPNQIALLTDETDEDKEGVMIRNRSAQMKKNQLHEPTSKKKTKTTKSQNLKKKKSKAADNSDMRILINGFKDKDNKQISENSGEYDEQPSLPVFRHNKKKLKNGQNQDSLSDGLNQGQLKLVPGMMSHRGHHRSDNRKQQSPQNKNRANSINNLEKKSRRRNDQQNQSGQLDEDGDDIPKMHSSEQINSLIIHNKTRGSARENNMMQSHDDESIYRKIFNDDTETLKSVQNDIPSKNYEISPSYFNVQNQRFDETDISQTDNVPQKPIIHTEGNQFDEDDPYQNNNRDKRKNKKYNNDQQSQEPTVINRYGSQHNIVEYDSVIGRRVNNEKIKKLQEIYLPRLDVNKSKRK